MCIILKISLSFPRSKKIILDRRRILNINYKLYYLEMHGLLSLGKIRTGSCKIAIQPRIVFTSFDSSVVHQFIRSYPIIAEPIRTSPDSIHSIPCISSTFSTSPTSPLLLLFYFYRRYSPFIFEFLPFYFLLIFFFFYFSFFFSVFQSIFFQQIFIKNIYFTYTCIYVVFRGGDIRPLDPRVKLTDMRIIKEVLTVRIWSRRADVVRRNSW